MVLLQVGSPFFATCAETLVLFARCRHGYFYRYLLPSGDRYVFEVEVLREKSLEICVWLR